MAGPGDVHVESTVGIELNEIVSGSLGNPMDVIEDMEMPSAGLDMLMSTSVPQIGSGYESVCWMGSVFAGRVCEKLA